MRVDEHLNRIGGSQFDGGSPAMIEPCRAAERVRDGHGKVEVWHTFSAVAENEAHRKGFGILKILDEENLPPGASVPRHPPGDHKVITYVRMGALAHEDSLGRSGVIHTGEFQRMIAGPDMRRSERNASRTDDAQVFQMWLRPSESGLESSVDQRRFTVAERSGHLCAVASQDGRQGSLRIHADATIFSAILAHGQHVVHALPAERSAWLHVVAGHVTVGDVVLNSGDGLAFTEERPVSMTALEESELLLIDLGVEAPENPAVARPRRTAGASHAMK